MDTDKKEGVTRITGMGTELFFTTEARRHREANREMGKPIPDTEACG
jgi:hypothetical protein